MKKLAGAIFALLMLGLTVPQQAQVTEIEWLGRLTGMGGATAESWKRKQSEANAEAHGFGYLAGLGMIPVIGPLGVQVLFSYDGANGHRFDGSAGPVFDWGGGKIGVFMHRQYRLIPQPRNRSNEFAKVRNWWVTPAASFYDLIPGTNINIWHRQPLTRSFDGSSFESSDGWRNKRFIPYSQTRLDVNVFPNFLVAKDNLELTVGVQINALSGPQHENVALGAGPVLGAAMLPLAGVPLEVTLVNGTYDSKGRYRVSSGIQYYFVKGNATLLQLRRKYLEPTNLPGAVSTFHGT